VYLKLFSPFGRPTILVFPYQVLTVMFKMAASAVVLYFLANKFGRTATRALKSMVLDFYDVGVLCDAKSQL